MRALLTGSGGFCGRHLAHYLAADDVEVHSMTVHGQASRYVSRIASATDLQGMRHSLVKSSPDFVFHLAGTANADNAVDFYRVNTLYAVSLLEALDRAGLASVPVLLVGTAAEFGRVEASDLPLSESHPSRPVSHYGASKLAQTNAGLAAARMGRPVVVVRPFNIIGPGVPKQLVVGNIVDQLSRASRRSGRVRLRLGNIDSTRDFIDVEDVMGCYWDIIRRPAAYGQVINICTGRETSVRDLIHRMADLTGLELVIDRVDTGGRANDIARHFGANRRLQELTGRRPILDLRRTLKRILHQAAVLQ